MKNAVDFPGLYEDLEIPYKLGCLMLDTENPTPGLTVDPKDEYAPNDPKMPYVKGLARDWHMTVKYGFLEPVRRKHVEQVIEGMDVPSHLLVVDFSVFPGSNGEFEYVVAHADSPKLRRMNRQLHVLPNVDTFVEYMPHITVGYFRPGWGKENLLQLSQYIDSYVETKGLNFGSML